MTEEVFGYLVYSTMLFAVIALLWTKRNFIKRNFIKKLLPPKVVPTSTNEYDTIMKNKVVQFALNWKNSNHGRKQNENVFRNNGKKISKSEAYKSIHKKVFEI
jgi:hypothetical protein